MAKAQLVILQGPCVLKLACLAAPLLLLLLPHLLLLLLQRRTTWRTPLSRPETTLADQERRFLDMRPLMTTGTLTA